MRRYAWYALVPFLASACTGRAAIQTAPAPRASLARTATYETPAALRTKERVRLVLIGDTGENSTMRSAIVKQLPKEQADMVLLLGDLVYPRGPRCTGGALDARARAVLDEHIDTPFGGLGVPVLIVLGNHDVLGGIFGQSPKMDQEACFAMYVREKQAVGRPLVMPGRHYTVSLGPASLAVVSSSPGFLDDSAATMSRRLFATRDSDWDVLVSHHVFKTFHDKENEKFIPDWLTRGEVRPHMVTNGHAHFLQMGSYDGVLAITSGSGARLRPQNSCAIGTPTASACGAGEYFGLAGGNGYVVLELTSAEAHAVFKDHTGAARWSCTARRGSGTCDAENR